MRYAIPFLLCLAACAASHPDWSAVDADATRHQQQCKADNPGDRVAAARCGTEATHNIFAAAGFPFMDLLDQFNANLVLATEQRVEGKLTEAGYDAAVADLRARYASAVDQRITNGQERRAATVGAMRLPTICNQVGYATVCN